MLSRQVWGLRMHAGLMYDDLYSDKEPVIERALELLPEDIATARYRRIMRATHLNHIRLYLPPHGKLWRPLRMGLTHAGMHLSMHAHHMHAYLRVSRKPRLVIFQSKTTTRSFRTSRRTLKRPSSSFKKKRSSWVTTCGTAVCIQVGIIAVSCDVIANCLSGFSRPIPNWTQCVLLFSSVGGCTGLGDSEPGMHFLVSFPNMYGGGGGPHNKAHLSSLSRSKLR